MNIPYLDSIFLGLVRIFLWILFLYAMKRLFFKAKDSRNQVDTMARLWVLYASLVVLMVFLLVQINSYDLMTLLFILVVFLGLRLIGVKNMLWKPKRFKRKRIMILLDVLEKVEDKEPIIDVVEGKPTKRLSVNFKFVVMALVGFSAMAIRFYLMKYDNYQVSSSWFQELSILKNLGQQNWFNTDLVMAGEYALMNFYGKMTGISPEIALESFGILQAFILCFILFWFMNVMTGSNITIPLIAALSYAFFFNLAPINLAEITHGKQTLMAIIFALPAMVYLKKPWLLYRSQPKAYMAAMIVIFTTIAFIDLFTLLVLLPPYFLVAVFFVQKKYRKFFNKGVLAYLIATTMVLGLYAFMCYKNKIDYGLFLSSNLLSVTSTTSTANMITSLDKLLFFVRAGSIITIIVMFVILKRSRHKWSNLITFLIYVNVLIFYSELNFTYFDKDLFNEVLPVLIVITLAISAYLSIYLLVSRLKSVLITEKVSVALIIIIFLSVAYYSQRDLLFRPATSSDLPKDVIAAYQQVSASYLPYSYAVVNSSTFQPLSTDSHNFITYRDFIGNYDVRDSVYFENKQNKEFLRANTEYIIPNSLLVFIYDTENQFEFTQRVNYLELTGSVKAQMEMLRGRGRKVEVFFKKGGLTVFEIVNNEGEAKIKELL